MNLYNTPLHAAATAWSSVADTCRKTVHERSARSLYPLIYEVAGTSDGAGARRSAGAIATVVEHAFTVRHECTSLVLACERWLLHPVRQSEKELVTAAYEYVRVAPMVELDHAEMIGIRIEEAIEQVRSEGIDVASADTLATIACACHLVVPLVWVAKQVGVTRGELRNRLRRYEAQSG